MSTLWDHVHTSVQHKGSPPHCPFVGSVQFLQRGVYLWGGFWWSCERVFAIQQTTALINSFTFIYTCVIKPVLNTEDIFKNQTFKNIIKEYYVNSFHIIWKRYNTTDNNKFWVLKFRLEFNSCSITFIVIYQLRFALYW